MEETVEREMREAKRRRRVMEEEEGKEEVR